MYDCLSVILLFAIKPAYAVADADTRALEIYHAASDGYHEALTEYGLAKLYLKKGQYHKTLRYANKAVSFFEDSGHTSEMMECYQLLGIVYETCRDYEKSDEYYLSYVKAARIANDSVRLVTGLNNIAAFASSIGDTAKTIRLLMESIALSESAGDSAQLCQLYINAAAAISGCSMPLCTIEREMRTVR